jgi:hypothetical protein
MTRERKKALLLVGATFIVGILIGALGMSLISKQAGRPAAGSRTGGKEVLIRKIIDTIEADSAQAEKIRPYILETIARIDSLQEKTNNGLEEALIAFETNVQPILSEQQLEKLRQLHQRSRERRARERVNQ